MLCYYNIFRNSLKKERQTHPLSMRTQLRKVDPENPAPEIIAEAANLLRNGELVAFPTETVYGLGANALDEQAVRKIFQAKGRPASNPLIVHVATIQAAQELAETWPKIAQTLADAFWPGSLTLVVPRPDRIPDIVTANGSTVAIRIPSHPVALALLLAADVPVAAPSANRSNHLSPTQAEHVWNDLQGKVDLILDAGPCPGGLESTVLDVTTNPPRLLRPGLVSPAEIEGLIGSLLQMDKVNPENPESQPRRSPGMMSKHYAPQAVLECTQDDGWQRVEDLAAKGHKVGWLTWTNSPEQTHSTVEKVTMPINAKDYSARLYATLHDLDAMGVQRIVVALPPQSEEWLAVRDRLRRASG